MSIPAKKSMDAETAGKKSGSTIVKSSKRERKLTRQDKKFIDLYVETGNATRSAIEAYKIKNYGYARVKGSEQLANPNIEEIVETTKKSIAEQIPDDLLVQTHLDGLKATTLHFNRIGKSTKIEDYSVRQKYLDSAYKLKGSYAPDKSIILNVDLTSEEREKLERTALEAVHKLDA